GGVLLTVSFLCLLIHSVTWILFLAMFIFSVSELLVLPFTSTVILQRAHQITQAAYMGLNGLAFSVSHIISPSLGTQVAANFGFDVLWLSTVILASISTLGFYLIGKHMQTPAATQ